MTAKARQARKRRPWNAGITVGQRGAFTPEEVRRIRSALADRGVKGYRDLAMFNLAIDTMLQAPELLRLTVKDVRLRDGTIRTLLEIRRARKSKLFRCALSNASVGALEQWIASSEKKPSDLLFPGRVSGPPRPMTPRNMARLLQSWAQEAGLDATKFGMESLRRTKALHILNSTGDLETVRALLGHSKIESTANYLRITRAADPIAVARAFDI